MTSIETRSENKGLGNQKRAQCRNDQEPIPMLKLAPVKNAHIYARRKSAHNATNYKIEIKPVPPPIPLRPSMHTNLGFVPSPPLPKDNPQIAYSPAPIIGEPRALPPTEQPICTHSFITSSGESKQAESRRLPPRPPTRSNCASRAPRPAKKQSNSASAKATAFEFGNSDVDSNERTAGGFATGLNRPPSTSPPQHHRIIAAEMGEKRIRQGSSISSGDSFSQTSSPGYTSKNMETPLLPLITSSKVTGMILNKIQKVNEENVNGTTTITKSASTPASLQTIVRFQGNSNLSLHHRV